MKQNNTLNVRYMTVTGILSACAFLLQYLEIVVPFMPSFIKFDFSDLPALIGSFALGPAAGITIEFLKNLIHCIASQSFGVGELSNFMLGAIFVGVSGALYKRKKTRTNAIFSAFIGALVMAAVSFPSNVFVVYPVYYNFMPKEVILSLYQKIIPAMTSVEESILVFNVPFTFVKGMINVIITVLVYKPLSRVIKGTDIQTPMGRRFSR